MIKKKKAEPIKEVKELADLIHSEDETIVVLFYGDSLVLAERLYNEGYRKASEVAREIFEEIEKIAMHGVTPFGLCLMSMGEAAFAQLKKKYLGEDINAPIIESEGEG